MKTIDHIELYMKDGMIYHGDDLFTGIEDFGDGIAFYRNGELHREDGPSIEYRNGRHTNQYHVDGDACLDITEWAKKLGIYDTDEFTMLKLKWG